MATIKQYTQAVPADNYQSLAHELCAKYITKPYIALDDEDFVYTLKDTSEMQVIDVCAETMKEAVSNVNINFTGGKILFVINTNGVYQISMNDVG